jgi:hypothetical protein
MCSDAGFDRECYQGGIGTVLQAARELGILRNCSRSPST